jgi:holo-[acyl-carrier protein] synthase
MYVGIDMVEIERFNVWHNKSIVQLRRILSHAEIEYCLSNKVLSAQRFAVRFAAKEALYKALSQLVTPLPPFLTLCQISSICHTNTNIPFFEINGDFLQMSSLQLNVSLSHTKTIASAIVVVSPKDYDNFLTKCKKSLKF